MSKLKAPAPTTTLFIRRFPRRYTMALRLRAIEQGCTMLHVLTQILAKEFPAGK